MNISDAVKKIVSDVTDDLLRDFTPSIYVGKTNNVVRRANEHQEEGLPCTLRIAHGDARLIAKLEKQLISQFKGIKNCKLLNKEEGSLGNPEADWLYISLSECHPNDELCEYDETLLLGKEYPLNIK